MISFFITLTRFLRAIRHGLRDPEFRALLFVLIVTLAGGTVFYSVAENWEVIDSFYFSVITLTTIGYGDLHPTTPFSKLFTVLYIFLGIGIIMTFINKLAEHTMRRRDHHKTSDETREAKEAREQQAKR